MSETVKDKRQGNQQENRKKPLGNIPSLFEELKTLLPPNLIRKKTGRCTRDILIGSISYIKRLQQIQRMTSPLVDIPDQPPPQNLTPIKRDIPKRQMVKDILKQQRRQKLQSQQQQRKLIPVPAPKIFAKPSAAVAVPETVKNKNVANGDSDYVILDLDDQQQPQEEMQMTQPKCSGDFYLTKDTVIKLKVEVDDSECNVEDCMCKLDASLEMENGSFQKKIGEWRPGDTMGSEIALKDHDYAKHPFWVESLPMPSTNQTDLAEKYLVPINPTREEIGDKENLYGQEAGDETQMEEIDKTRDEILQDDFCKELFQEEKIFGGFSTAEISSGDGCTPDVTNNLAKNSPVEKPFEDSCHDTFEDLDNKKLIPADLEKSLTEILAKVLSEGCDPEIVKEIATEKDSMENIEETGTGTQQEFIEENVFNDSGDCSELDNSDLGAWFEKYFETYLAKKE